jgi:hypothetical protein
MVGVADTPWILRRVRAGELKLRGLALPPSIGRIFNQMAGMSRWASLPTLGLSPIQIGLHPMKSETHKTQARNDGQKTSARTAGTVICFLVAGGGVGWLIGLSVSPVIHIVVTSLLTFVVSTASLIVGLGADGRQSAPESGAPQPQQTKRFSLKTSRLELYPMALVILGVVAGSALGVYGRTNSWLGPNVAKIVRDWERLGMSRKEIATRLFDQVYPPANSGEKQTPKEKSTGAPKQTLSIIPGLLAEPSVEECLRLQAAPDEKLEELMRSSTHPQIREFAKRCSGNTSCLRAAVEVLICPDVH